VHFIRRCSRSSSKGFIDTSPNSTANFFSGRFGNEHEPLVPNGIPSNLRHYSRIYRYGPAPPSKTSHCSTPGASEHDRLSRVREAPSLSRPCRHGSFNNRNAEVNYLRRARETPPPSQPSYHDSRNTSQTWWDHSAPGPSYHDLPWRIPETPPPTHYGNRTSRNNLNASRSYTYRHPDDQQIQGEPNHVFPASSTTSVPASASDTGANGAPPPPYTRFPVS